jgi:hypothetical protein
VKRLLLIAAAAALAACGADLDEPWQLAHDRIIAVRATPPRIVSGEQSTLDLLLGYAEMPVEERAPDLAMVVSPTSLADVLAPDGGKWVVTAPDEDRLAAARAELGLEADEPVPLQVGVAVMWPYDVASVDGRTFAATKTIYLGESAKNPELIGMMIDGSEPASELVVPKEDKVPLFVEADDKLDIVNWLTSCGEMHDFDLHSAYLKVLPDQPQEGQLAVVLRDDQGGVTWRVWPIHAE